MPILRLRRHHRRHILLLELGLLLVWRVLLLQQLRRPRLVTVLRLQRPCLLILLQLVLVLGVLLHVRLMLHVLLRLRRHRYGGGLLVLRWLWLWLPRRRLNGGSGFRAKIVAVIVEPIRFITG